MNSAHTSQTMDFDSGVHPSNLWGILRTGIGPDHTDPGMEHNLSGAQEEKTNNQQNDAMDEGQECKVLETTAKITQNAMASLIPAREFPRFSELPAELQAMIWERAIIPRLIRPWVTDHPSFQEHGRPKLIQVCKSAQKAVDNPKYAGFLTAWRVPGTQGPNPSSPVGQVWFDRRVDTLYASIPPTFWPSFLRTWTHTGGTGGGTGVMDLARDPSVPLLVQYDDLEPVDTSPNDRRWLYQNCLGHPHADYRVIVWRIPVYTGMGVSQEGQGLQLFNRHNRGDTPEIIGCGEKAKLKKMLDVLHEPVLFRNEYVQQYDPLDIRMIKECLVDGDPTPDEKGHPDPTDGALGVFSSRLAEFRVSLVRAALDSQGYNGPWEDLLDEDGGLDPEHPLVRPVIEALPKDMTPVFEFYRACIVHGI